MESWVDTGIWVGACVIAIGVMYLLFVALTGLQECRDENDRLRGEIERLRRSVNRSNGYGN